jgi:hypothetical protein
MGSSVPLYSLFSFVTPTKCSRHEMRKRCEFGFESVTKRRALRPFQQAGEQATGAVALRLVTHCSRCPLVAAHSCPTLTLPHCCCAQQSAGRFWASLPHHESMLHSVCPKCVDTVNTSRIVREDGQLVGQHATSSLAQPQRFPSPLRRTNPPEPPC